MTSHYEHLVSGLLERHLSRYPDAHELVDTNPGLYQHTRALRSTLVTVARQLNQVVDSHATEQVLVGTLDVELSPATFEAARTAGADREQAIRRLRLGLEPLRIDLWQLPIG